MDDSFLTHSSQNVDGCPYWSVMIPTYRPQEVFLRETLESVLQQDIGKDQMQIEVVDDCSPDVDVEKMVFSIAGSRVGCCRNPKNLGLAGCWNRCIQRSSGEYVHILHQDDYVLPDFYGKLRRAAEQHPKAALLATRSFSVDQHGVILGVSERVRELEQGEHAVECFFYRNPIQCPSVVMRRSFYEAHGGFRDDLPFILDVEMWSRAVGLEGGIVLPDVLAGFRTHGENATLGLERTAESLRDVDRLIRIYAERYPTYDRKRSILQLAAKVLDQAIRFSKTGDRQAAKANWDYWKEHVPLMMRLRVFAARSALYLSTRFFRDTTPGRKAPI